MVKVKTAHSGMLKSRAVRQEVVGHGEKLCKVLKITLLSKAEVLSPYP